MDKKLKLISITRIIGSSLCLIFTLTGCGPVFGPRGRMGPGMMGLWGMGWFGVILVILIVILVIVALIFLLPRLKQELYLKVVFKGKGGVSTGRLLAAVNRPH